MAIAVEVTTDSPLDDYYEGVKKLGGSPGGPHPDPACLFHWVTELDGGGWRVTDVWETKEQALEFIQGRVAPIMEEIGGSEPQVRFIEVASILTAGQPVPVHAG